MLKVAGKVICVDLAKDRDGKSKGYASVQFSEPTEAINAIGIILYFALVESILTDMSPLYSSLPWANAV